MEIRVNQNWARAAYLVFHKIRNERRWSNEEIPGTSTKKVYVVLSVANVNCETPQMSH